jgi:tetratricopeptide (TPR) repeat protein
MKTFRYTIKTLHFFPLIISVLILAACSNSPLKKELALLQKGEVAPKGIEVCYPLDGTIFPPEFPAPGFEWKQATGSSSKWTIFVSDDQGKVLIEAESGTNNWRPDSLAWEKLKKHNLKNFSFTVFAEKVGNTAYPSGKIGFSFSTDPVGAEIFYRAVTLPFSYAVKNVHTIEWYMGSVDGRKPRKMLDNLPVCGNCHSFAKDQPLLAMDIDYGNDKGSYAIAKTQDTCRIKPENIITWSDYKKEDNEATFGLLSQISPDGNNVLSTVKDLSIFVAVDNNMAYSQLFFPIKGIIGVYNRQTKTFDALNGASDPKYVQSNPVWSPDGKKIIFAKTEAYVNEKVKKAGKALLTLNDVNEFTTGGKQFKYDLYSIDFNNGKGGVATPLEGASFNGKSNYFPKFSPDGKWIVFCQAENFMLLQPDSRLYIMPSGGGVPRLMNCNMAEMNSWHSWSPNGRWLVFSSKNKGLYTQLYLTHIDENGMDSPPVLLENLCFEKRAANIPEFYPFDAKSFSKITDEFSKTAEYFNRVAFDKMSNKFFKRAYDDLQQALDIDKNYLETYVNRIMLNGMLRQSNSKEDLADKQKAMQLVVDSLSLKPGNENYLSLKISLLSNMGKEKEAINEAISAIRVHPNSYKLHDLLGSIYRREEQFQKAIECYTKMIAIDPTKKPVAVNLMAAAYLKLNQHEQGLQAIAQTIKDYPNNNDLLAARALIYLNKKQFDLAYTDINRLFAKDTANYQFGELLAQFYAAKGDKKMYFDRKRKNLQLLLDRYNKNKEDIDVIFEIASFYMSAKDFQSAENHYDLVLASFPNNYEALKQKAIIKLNSQKWDEALSIYDKLEANYQLEEGFCNNKAIAFIQKGDFKSALQYFDKTLKINPTNKDAIFNRDRLKSEMARH